MHKNHLDETSKNNISQHTHLISILGIGKFGTALAHTINTRKIKQNKTNWHLYAYDISNDHPPSFCDFSTTLTEALFLAENQQYVEKYQQSNIKHWIITAIPAAQIIKMLTIIKNYPLSNPTILLVSKGTNTDGNFISNSIQEQFGTHFDIASLAGPHFAHDLMNQSNTITLIGSNPTDQEILSDMFSDINPSFISNPLAVQIACVMKNMAAFCCGAAAGLGLSESTKSTIFALCIEDTKTLLAKYNCPTDIATQAAILADWIMCCTSNTSRNYQAGYDFAVYNKAPTDYLAESVKSIQAFHGFLSKTNIHLPSIDFVYKCTQTTLEEAGNIKSAMETFLSKSIRA